MLSYDGLKTARDSCCTLDTLDIRAIPYRMTTHQWPPHQRMNVIIMLTHAAINTSPNFESTTATATTVTAVSTTATVFPLGFSKKTLILLKGVAFCRKLDALPIGLSRYGRTVPTQEPKVATRRERVQHLSVF